MNQKHRPTLRTIAERAEVSLTAVSMALRNSIELPAATRERIQRIARELGYVPDALLATMMAHVRARKPPRQQVTLAFITSFPRRDDWQKETVYREYFEGAQQRAEQLGYQLEVVWSKEPGMSGRRLTQILLARNIRGLLICSLPRDFGHLSLDWSKFASATFGYSLRKPELHRVSYDHFRGVTELLHRVKRLRYRRVGLVQEQANARINDAYLAAFYGYQAKVPVRERVPLLLSDPWSDKAFREWLLRHEPDMVVAPGPRFVSLIRDCGREVPRDVGMVALQLRDDPEPCAGMDNNSSLVGAEAVNLVVRQLQHHEFGVPSNPVMVHVEGTWRDGPTVRPLPMDETRKRSSR